MMKKIKFLTEDSIEMLKKTQKLCTRKCSHQEISH